MGKMQPKLRARLKRKRHVRKKVTGTPQRPRLVVYRSLKHIYAQVVDDTVGRTITGASTCTPELREIIRGLKKREAAEKVGELIAKRCAAANITKVVFDRNGFKYHGRLKHLADAARKAGLEF